MGRENAKDMHGNYNSSVCYCFPDQYFRMGSLSTNGMEFQLREHLRKLCFENASRKSRKFRDSPNM